MVFNLNGMKDVKLQDEVRELLWRRKLTDAELTKVPVQPEVLAELELETRLSQSLAKMLDTTVPSNFTARLMQAIELEESQQLRRRKSGWNWQAFLPRIAVTAAVILFAGLTVRHYDVAARRSALVRNVALVAGAQTLPSVDALKNFDVIQRMSQPHADDELLALMQ
ncbi:MAG: hypothetical protein WDN00_16410 [Limisphaerales bacterium]